VDLASVRGGRPPLDAVQEADPVQRAFLADPGMRARLAATRRPDGVPGAPDVLFLAGGHGAAWDFPGDGALAGLVRRSYAAGGIVSAVCHGPAGLFDVTLDDGGYLVAGRQVAAFSNDEERAIGMTRVVPFLLADRLAERGADYVAGPSFVPFVVADGRLVTGQNPPSAAAVAEEAVRAAAGGGPVTVTG
jgi:putative intracellular protease/amidase